jgi:hypothetical protein
MRERAVGNCRSPPLTRQWRTWPETQTLELHCLVLSQLTAFVPTLRDRLFSAPLKMYVPYRFCSTRHNRLERRGESDRERERESKGCARKTAIKGESAAHEMERGEEGMDGEGGGGARRRNHICQKMTVCRNMEQYKGCWSEKNISTIACSYARPNSLCHSLPCIH